MKQGSFILSFSILSVCIAVALYLMGSMERIQPVMTYAWICLALFILLTLGTYYMAVQSMKGRFQNFMNIFFAGIIIKFFVVGTMVMVYKYSSGDASDSIAFIIPFAVIYFPYLFFETFFLVRQSKVQS